jgi:hypothetical protein
MALDYQLGKDSILGFHQLKHFVRCRRGKSREIRDRVKGKRESEILRKRPATVQLKANFIH